MALSDISWQLVTCSWHVDENHEIELNKLATPVIWSPPVELATTSNSQHPFPTTHCCLLYCLAPAPASTGNFFVFVSAVSSILHAVGIFRVYIEVLRILYLIIYYIYSLYLQFENLCAFAKGSLPIWFRFRHLCCWNSNTNALAGIAQTQSSHHIASEKRKPTRMHWPQPRPVELQERFDYHWLQQGHIPDIFVDSYHSFCHKADEELERWLLKRRVWRFPVEHSDDG